jgi:hypothetical protein
LLLENLVFALQNAANCVAKPMVLVANMHGFTMQYAWFWLANDVKCGLKLLVDGK